MQPTARARRLEPKWLLLLLLLPLPSSSSSSRAVADKSRGQAQKEKVLTKSEKGCTSSGRLRLTAGLPGPGKRCEDAAGPAEI
eukprot:3460450-Amphidinium_carterae.1